MVRPSILLAALVALSQAPLWASTAAAQDDFYRGKTITIIIPIGPGGAYDAYARLITRHMPRHLPGNPTMIARNMPGAGGVIASNHVYNTAPQDGTTLTIITSSFANEQVAGNPQIKYDAQKFLADRPAARHHLGAVLLARVADQDAARHADQAGHGRDLVDPRGSRLSAARDEPIHRHAAQADLRLSRRARLRAGRRTRRDRRRHLDLHRAVATVFRSSQGEEAQSFRCSSPSTARRTCRICPPSSSSPRTPRRSRSSSNSSATTRSGARSSPRPNVPPRAAARCCVPRFRRCWSIPNFAPRPTKLRLPLAPRSGEEMQKTIADMFAVAPETLAKIRELSK